MRETYKERNLCRCKHFTGYRNPACAVGVRYDDVKQSRGEDKGFDLPCLGELDNCNRREFPTLEEVEKEEREMAALMSRISEIRTAVVEATGGRRGVAGRIKCPCCEDGRVSFSVAGYNGHIHAQCSTKGCASWME